MSVRGVIQFFISLLVMVLSLPAAGFSADSTSNGSSDGKAASPRSEIQFNRDIRPILSDHCYQCHGPDAATREAELRLDDPQAVLMPREGKRIIVPGDSGASELFRRITTTDENERMPPAASRRPLTPKQIDLLQQWIQQGAGYDSHWSFVTPIRPPLPELRRGDHARTGIDCFVLSRLESEGLEPSPQADLQTLARRTTIDLTGLPPTLETIDEFVSENLPDSQERLIDRLLATPLYGERMAMDWLDAARYADTHGYLFDTERFMWRWRDGVIESFNANQPFDQFSIEQLAGDLLPDATLSQKIASGFNRNHIINNEAGAIPDEYFVENIVDRLNTTATVWMGLSLACAQCHDHKYDPISQREYYQLYAFFNNLPEVGLDGFNSNAKPLLAAPTWEERQRLSALDARVAAADAEFAPLETQIREAQQLWEKQVNHDVMPPQCGSVAELALDGDGVIRPTPDRMAEFKDGVPAFEAGLIGQSAAFDGQRYLELGDVADFDIQSPFTLAAWIYQTNLDGRRAIFSRMEPAEANFRGYALQMIQGSAALFLVHEFPENLLQVQVKKPIEPHQWHHVLATYDGSGKAEGVQIYVDGVRQEVNLVINKLSKGFRADKPLQVGNGYPGAKFLGRIDEARLFDRVLSQEEIARLPGLSIESLLKVESSTRNDEQTRRIRDHYLRREAPAEWRDRFTQIVQLRDERKNADRGLPSVMVMQERNEARETKILIRGAYNRPGETVSLGTPAFLPAMAEQLPRNRLGLARWLVDPQHPLTARVTANRLWQLSFSQGIVRTSENLGMQGDWPSHPELLDWLALELQRVGWDLKRFRRLVLLSATFRQSSRLRPDLVERDPHNRLLARGPRFRLQAESIRDAALAWSGLLVERMGGRSVKPYMSAEVWREVAFDPAGATLTAQVYKQDQGESLYRRGMYTFWKRTAPPPTMLIFDAPDRERCVVRREQTNTPLQALVLMNDPTFVEASRKLAERMLLEGGATIDERIAWGFRQVMGRNAGREELQPLRGLYDRQYDRFRDDPASAEELLKIGESPRAVSSNLDLAPLTVIANVILNLDEALTQH